MIRHLLFATLCVSPAFAEDVAAPNGESIRFGEYNGVVYYTETIDGYHVVATVAVVGGPPIRFKATLTDGQQMIISTPGLLGEADSEVGILRNKGALTIIELVPATALAIEAQP